MSKMKEALLNCIGDRKSKNHNLLKAIEHYYVDDTECEDECCYFEAIYKDKSIFTLYDNDVQRGKHRLYTIIKDVQKRDRTVVVAYITEPDVEREQNEN